MTRKQAEGSSERAREEEVGEDRGAKGLKQNAIGFFDALIIGVASVSPAYSLAVALGLLAVTVGVQAPATILMSFVPMLFVAAAYYYMNRADQDCGTVFSWATRAMGPWVGWLAGWTMIITSTLVVGSFGELAARYTFLLVGWQSAAGSKAAVLILAVVYIATMTAVAVRGIELSSRVDNILAGLQVSVLLLFAGVALARVYTGSAPEGTLKPELSWFSPFAVEGSASLVGGLLIGIFLYWGWEASVTVNEETRNGHIAPGLAALASTIALLTIYLSVTVALMAFAGVGTVGEYAGSEEILSSVASGVLGSPLDRLLLLAVLTAALAATQIVIMAVSRTSLSMATARALPAPLAKVHPVFATPYVSSIVIGTFAAFWYVVFKIVSENFFYDTTSGMSILVVLFYALAGLTPVIYYRKQLFKSARNLIFIGVVPLLGSVMLVYLFFRSLITLADPGESYTGASLFGVGLPVTIAVGFLFLGLVVVIIFRFFGDHGRFFDRRPETADPGVAVGRSQTAETVGTPTDKS